LTFVAFDPDDDDYERSKPKYPDEAVKFEIVSGEHVLTIQAKKISDTALDFTSCDLVCWKTAFEIQDCYCNVA